MNVIITSFKISDAIDDEIMRLLGDGPKRANVETPVVWDVSISASRLAAILLDKGRTGKAPSRIITAVMYGVQSQFEIAKEDDKMVTFSVGSIRAYGGSGVQILACGGEPDDWLQKTHEQNVTSSGRALHLGVQWCPTGSEDINDDENKSQPQKDISHPESSHVNITRKKHLIFELSVATLQCRWDDASLTALRDLYFSICKEDVIFARESFPHEKQEAARLSNYYFSAYPKAESDTFEWNQEAKAYQWSNSRPKKTRKLIDVSILMQHVTKWSVDIFFEGGSLLVPYQSSKGNTDFGLDSVKSVGSSNGSIPKIPTFHFICFRMGQVVFQGGNFLDPLLSSLTTDETNSKVEAPEENKKSSLEANDKQFKQVRNPTSEIGFDTILGSTQSSSPFSCSMDEFIRGTAAKRKCLAVSPIIFKVLDLELVLLTAENDVSVLQNFSTCSMLTRLPWCISGVFSPSSLPSHPQYADLCLDFTSSPFHVALSSQEIITLLDAFHRILQIFMNKEKPVSQNTLAPRLKRFASICRLRVHAYLKDAKIALVSDVENSYHSQVGTILFSFGNLLIHRGGDFEVIKASRRLVRQRLQKILFLDEAIVKRIVSNFMKDVETVSVEKAVEVAKLAFVDVGCSTELHKEPIFELDIALMEFTFCKLTYDFRCGMKLQRLLLSDHDRYPILELSSTKKSVKNDNYVPKMRQGVGSEKNDANRSTLRANRTSSGMGSHAKTPEKIPMSTLKDFLLKSEKDEIEHGCALSISYVEQDVSNIPPMNFCSWGVGGCDLQILYDPVSPISQSLTKRDGQFVISSASVKLLLSATSIPEIVSQIVPAARSILSRWNEIQLFQLRRVQESAFEKTKRGSITSKIMGKSRSGSYASNYGNSSNVIQPPVFQRQQQRKQLAISLRVNFENCDILLSNQHDIFALFSLEKTRFLLNSTEEGDEARSIWINITSLQAFDFTEAGSLHANVIWKEPSSKSMLSLHLTLGTETLTVVSVDLKGMRFCFLYRFILEFLEFNRLFIDSMIKAINPTTEGGNEDFDHLDEESKLYGIDSPEDSSVDGDVEDITNNHNSDSSSSDDDSTTDDSSLENVGIRTIRSGKSFPDYSIDSQSLQTPRRVLRFSVKSTIAPNNEVEGVDNVNDFNSTHKKPSQNMKWSINFEDLTIICPRNSFSSDIVAFRISKGFVENREEVSTWNLPEGSLKAPGKNVPLYFDVKTNSWQFSTLPSRDSFFGSSSTSSFSLNNSELGEFWDVPNHVNKGGGSERGNSSEVVDEEDDEQFFDAIEESGGKQNNSLKSTVEAVNTSSNVDAIYRISSALSSVSVFISISNLSSALDQSLDDRKRRKKIGEVQDNGFVYKETSDKRKKETNFPRWKKVSLEDFNMMLVVDFLKDDRVRTLLSDTEEMSCLDLKLSMADLYLIESIYFDNYFEPPIFFRSNFGDEEKGFQRNETQFPTDKRPQEQKREGGRPLHETMPLYGTKAYLDALFNIKPEFNFVVARADLRLECSMVPGMFSKEPPSLPLLLTYLASSNNYLRENKPTPNLKKRDGLNYIYSESKIGKGILPLATICLRGFVLHSRGDNDVTQLAASACEAQILDIRNPAYTAYPCIFRASSVSHLSSSSPLNDKYGEYLNYHFPDFSFGMNLTPLSMENTNFVSEVPLKVSFLSSFTSKWTTVNVGVDTLDLNIKNLEMFSLIGDYFSCYNRFPEFGHPAVIHFNSLPEKSKVYSGCDTRVFVTRPHISVMKNVSLDDSPSMFLETDLGVYYRHMIDSTNSVKIDLNLYEVAAVITDSYCPPSVARGLRGAAGSGRGVKTLIEYLNCAFTYHFDAPANHIDVLLSVFPKDKGDITDKRDDDSNYFSKQGQIPVAASDNSSFVDFDTDHLKIGSSFIGYPTCVSPLTQSTTHFPKNSCDIVSSYEDIRFFYSLISEFISGDSKESDDKNRDTDMWDPEEKSRDAFSPTPIDKQEEPSMFCILRMSGIKAVVVDNVLGLHLPLLQFFFDDLSLTTEKSTAVVPRSAQRTSILRSLGETSRVVSSRGRLFTTGGVLGSDFRRSQNLTKSIENMKKVKSKSSARIVIWADYFNNMKKCWEPLLEKLNASILYEESVVRGTGLTIRLHSAAHCNVSGALIRTLDDTINMIQSAQAEMDKDSGGSHFSTPKMYVRSTGGGRIFRKGRHVSKGFLHKKETSSVDAEHLAPQPLDDDVRVGFSIQNLTGQPLRYLQTWENGKNTVHYVNNNTRGLLNFVASTTKVRNSQIVEEAFNVQLDHNESSEHKRHRKKLVGHQVALQISGFEWLESVQADELGVKYEDLVAVPGRVRYDFSKTKMSNALKLVAEVVPHNGGRMLKLRSVFTMKNNTNHSIKLLALDYNVNETEKRNADKKSAEEQARHRSGEVPFVLQSGEDFHVPLALLHRTAIKSKTKKDMSLGYLHLKPADLGPVEKELRTQVHAQPGNVDYSRDAIQLHDIVLKTAEIMAGLDSRSADGSSISNEAVMMQLCCNINSRNRRIIAEHRDRLTTTDSNSASAGLHEGVNNTSDIIRDQDNEDLSFSREKLHSRSKFQPFCYNIEVQREGMNIENSKEGKFKISKLPAAFARGLFASKDRATYKNTESPLHYTIVIHPPIVLENLLPTGGTFEIMHATREKVLWSSHIDALESKPIHTVTLDEPLRLLINLRYCRTSPQGILIHKPRHKGTDEATIAGKMIKTFEGLIEGENEGEDTFVYLTDTCGQRLRLNIENVEGGGGQRKIAVYCPYWIVNTSQYILRIRADGSQQLPAGTVTPEK